MKMNIFKLGIAFLLIMAVTFFIGYLSPEGVVMAVIVGGPFRELKWGGLTLRPTSEGEAEYELSGTDFESQASPNGDDYATGSAKIGYAQQECAMTATEYKNFIDLKDGEKRAGTATTMGGDVLTLNCRIDGEQILSNGTLTVKLAGKVRVQ